MKRFFLLFFCSIFVCSAVVAQKTDGGKKKTNFPTGKNSETGYYDLLMLYMDGDFKSCVKKSLKVTEKEATSKDPMPYLYVSMSYFEMSQIEQYKKDFPNAFKDAVKFAIKYYKKDEKNSKKQGLKQLEFYDENKPYFEKLRKSLKELAEISLDAKRPSSAEAYYKQILQFDTLDYSSNYMMSILRTVANDPQGSEIYLANVKPCYDFIENGSVHPEDYSRLYKYAFQYEANYLISNGRTDLAKEKIARALELYPNDKELGTFKVDKGL